MLAENARLKEELQREREKATDMLSQLQLQDRRQISDQKNVKLATGETSTKSGSNHKGTRPQSASILRKPGRVAADRPGSAPGGGEVRSRQVAYFIKEKKRLAQFENEHYELTGLEAAKAKRKQEQATREAAEAADPAMARLNELLQIAEQHKLPGELQRVAATTCHICARIEALFSNFRICELNSDDCLIAGVDKKSIAKIKDNIRDERFSVQHYHKMFLSRLREHGVDEETLSLNTESPPASKDGQSQQ